LGPLKEVLHNSMSASDYSGYVEKLRVLAHTKVCLCHNVLHYNKNMPNYLEKFHDESYKPFFPWHGKPFQDVLCMPQLKSRVFEGALMGCVLLVYKDEYGTMDQYFQEGVDFIYFTSEEDLHQKLNHILTHYDDYIPMTKSAQRKVVERYSVEKFVDYMVTTLHSNA
jgi:spore maturation protein CgeB